MKTYRGRKAKRRHDAEVYAFRKLRYCRDIPNIIEFFSSYCLDGTYNILLEFADFDNLEHYLQLVKEPKASLDIVNFWTSLLGVLTPLMHIHDLRDQSDDSDDIRVMLGWVSWAFRF